MTCLLGHLLLAACGGATPPPATATADDPRELTERAEAAWAGLDPETAAALAARAVASGGGTVALEIAGRAYLALGRPAAALGVLRRASSPHLRRLRARARIATGDFAGAAADLADDDDPWAESARPALGAAGTSRLYVTRGAPAVLPLAPLPLPVVSVEIDGQPARAVISTGAEWTVLDPSVRASGGLLTGLSLGEVHVRAVPYRVRRLNALSEGLGVPIGAVLGLDLLFLLRARIDGPGQTLTLRPEARPPSTQDASAAFVTPTGSFLAIEGQIAATPVWLTVDTTGVYPVALVPGAEEALGLNAEWIEVAPGGPLQATIPVHLGSMRVEGTPVLRGVLLEGHARAVGAPVAGAVGWALLAQLVTRFEPRSRRLVFE